MHPEKISQLPLKDLEKLVHPSGFYRQKAKRLKSVSQYLNKSCRGDWESFLFFSVFTSPPELLEINGLGPEDG